MLKTLAYLITQKVVTTRSIPDALSQVNRGIPTVDNSNDCLTGCAQCRDVCPTNAISFGLQNEQPIINRASCVSCSLCVTVCPSQVIIKDLSVRTGRATKEQLIVTGDVVPATIQTRRFKNHFRKSIACRVVSTGCSACDLELAACFNPFFDIERFGVTLVASPRFADLLLVTGPAPLSMHAPIRQCYSAMAEPRKVIAVGTCACSGGLHSGGYSSANGLTDILPVDLFIPGCPPHPWSIIQGILDVMKMQI